MLICRLGVHAGVLGLIHNLGLREQKKKKKKKTERERMRVRRTSLKSILSIYSTFSSWEMVLLNNIDQLHPSIYHIFDNWKPSTLHIFSY